MFWILKRKEWIVMGLIYLSSDSEVIKSLLVMNFFIVWIVVSNLNFGS